MIFFTGTAIIFKLLLRPRIPIVKSNGKFTRDNGFRCRLKCSRAGTVESRIRQLVMKLEYVESLILAHPFVKGFDQVSYCSTEEEVHAVAQGEISDVISSRKKEDMEGTEGIIPVYSTTFYIGLQIEDKPGKILFLQYDCVDLLLRFCQVGSTGPRRLDISYPTTEFTKLVKMWEKFDEATMGIVVRHIKRLGYSFKTVQESSKRGLLQVRTA